MMCGIGVNEYDIKSLCESIKEMKYLFETTYKCYDRGSSWDTTRILVLLEALH